MNTSYNTPFDVTLLYLGIVVQPRRGGRKTSRKGGYSFLACEILVALASM